MLVLTRRESEKILIPDLGITLEIVRIKGNNVRIGIEAPPEIRVMRGELLDRKQHEAAISYSSEPDDASVVREQKSSYTLGRQPLNRRSECETNKIAC